MSQDNVPPPLTDAQMELMSIVWDYGECSVADVLRELRQQRSISRNAVHTTMTRLADRGWLIAREVDHRFLYAPAFPRENVQENCVQRLLSSVFGGSTEDLVLALLKNTTLKKGEASRIRRIIREAEEQQ